MSQATTLVLRTPEGVVFSQLLAGPVSRALAWLIDVALFLAFLIMLSSVVSLISLVAGETAEAFGVLLYFVFSVGYGIFFEWIWRGQTVGKRMLRLRVVDAQGLRLKPSQIVIRNLLRVVDLMPLAYLVGGLACVLNRRAQRLGDLAANTVVIRIPRTTEPNLEQLMAGKYNSFRRYPHLAGRLRQRLSADEAALALQALLRRDRLEPAARLELFGSLAGHLREQVRFPHEATEGITDEQYVRNVVDLLYRPERATPATARSQAAAASLP